MARVEVDFNVDYLLESIVFVNCNDFDHENKMKNTEAEATDCDALRATWSS